MNENIRPRRKKVRIILAAILLVLVALAGVFFWYVSDYYWADETSLAVLKEGQGITRQGNLTILSPEVPSDTAVIFYPGAKVEETAYLPLLDRLRQRGVTCILVSMPFHMAIFDVDAAADIIPQFPEVDRWYLAGHSMGGAMASKYAADHPEQVEGLILLGAYLYGDYPLERTLTICGTLDGLAAEDIDYTANVLWLEGGNHAQFGNYGPQQGDLPADISAQAQQAQTVEAVSEFLTESAAVTGGEAA